MNLKSIEKEIEGRIVERGFDYFRMENVEEVEELGEREFSATVFGSEEYSVFLKIDQDADIVEHDCDCPYDWGDYCKHVVAVLYFIRDGRRSGKNVKAGVLFEMAEELEKCDKFELKKIILDFAKGNKPFRKNLSRYFELEEDSDAR